MSEKVKEYGDISARFEIAKSDSKNHIAFGWAYQCVTGDGMQIEDWSGDVVMIEEIEAAAYRYVKLYRDGSEMHRRGGIGTLVESMVFTKEKIAALGLPEDALPQGWWVGIEIMDADVWNKVESGVYKMFSIEGTANRVAADKPIDEQ